MTIAAFPVLADEANDVSPPKSTDASRLTFPWPLTVGLIVFAVTIGSFVWRIEANVGAINARLDAREKSDAEIKDITQKYLDQRFATLESKIDAAGLRNANMALAQELQKERGK